MGNVRTTFNLNLEQGINYFEQLCNACNSLETRCIILGEFSIYHKVRYKESRGQRPMLPYASQKAIPKIIRMDCE